MPISQFILMTLVCVLQASLLAQSLRQGDPLLTLLWGLLLFRNLYKIYLVDRIGRVLWDMFNKKD